MAEDFASLLSRATDLAVVEAPKYLLKLSTDGRGLFQTGWTYLTSYRGLLFACVSPKRLELPAGFETIAAESVWLPPV